MTHCALPSCNIEFTPNHKRPDQKYCCDNHRAKHGREKKKEKAALSGPDDSVTQQPKLPFTPTPSPMITTFNPPAPVEKRTFEIPETGMSEQARYIIKAQEREIDRLDAHIKLLTNKNEDIIKERDGARHELAGLKTDQRIKEIEGAKPSGLNGLFPGGLEGILNNPHLGPVIGALASKMVGMLPAPGTPGQEPSAENSAVHNLMTWLGSQPPEVQRSYGELMVELVKVPGENMLDTLTKLLALLKEGSAMSFNPQHSNGTYEY